MSDHNLPDRDGDAPGWAGDDSFGGFGNQTPRRNPQEPAGVPPAREPEDEGGGGSGGG